uniref:Uncharacterized protein n=1 Tax=Molossus molossus TaxID=27622 RepID=A0A7J8DC46_MOLMO|nr:hypothetical protein HJG59_009355 [Molossus molossus]
MFIPYDVISTISLVTIHPLQSYYNTMAYFPYGIHYIPMTYLFYNWNFVPLIPLYILKNFFFFIDVRERERGREREREIETSMRENIDWLPPACTTLGIGSTTWASALTGNLTGDPLVHGSMLNYLVPQAGPSLHFFIYPPTSLVSPTLLLSIFLFQ